MKIFSFLDKIFDITAKVESTIEDVSKRTRLTIEKIVRDVMRNIINMLIISLSLLLVVTGLIILLARYVPIEYVLLLLGLLGFLVVALQKISIRIK